MEALRQAAASVERTFRRYPALYQPEAALAFSGGKDSVALARLLKVMGVATTLRAVDMGYSAAWRVRIEKLATRLGLPIEILVVSSLAKNETMDEKAQRDLVLRRAFLDSDDVHRSGVTPCTNCYNCKILSLVHGTTPAPITYFAHHRTDALASFLKSATMAFDRWAEGNTRFDLTRFRSLACRVGGDLLKLRSEYVRMFLSYLDEGLAQTSEPPLACESLYGRDYRIGRPFFELSEQVTTALAAEAELQPESSGCGHSLSINTRTPREIMHYEIIPVLEASDIGRKNLGKLFEAVVASLATDGTVTFDARRSRHQLLGTAYKGGPNELADRL